MIELRPSIARLLSLVATTLLATIFAAALAILFVSYWETDQGHSGGDFLKHLLSGIDEFPTIVGAFCFGTLLSSPLLLRLGRVSKHWLAALLAIVIVGLTVLLLVNDRMDFVERLLSRIFSTSSRYQLEIFVLIAFGQVVNTIVVSVLYRLGCRYLRRAKIPEDPNPEFPNLPRHRGYFARRRRPHRCAPDLVPPGPLSHLDRVAPAAGHDAPHPAPQPRLSLRF